MDNLKTVKLYFDARREANDIIDEFMPDAVIGTGGYVCAPIISAASKGKIFTVIHESNAALGFATRMLAGRCDLLLLGADIKTRFKNAEFVGNPTLDKFGAITKANARHLLGIPTNKKVLVSVGGSIGAKALNTATTRMMKEFSSKRSDIYHIHSSGKRYYDELKGEFPEFCQNGSRCKILPFIDNMPIYLSAADLIICRSGAMTLAEAGSSGCPMIMIPSPNVTADHQKKNALAYERAGAGIILEERKLTAQKLKDTAKSLLFDSGALEKMNICAKSFYKENPKKRIIDLLEARLC
jgi:UDP-N-acetylglucosamine--N-acetylmuramyl-(pentapeptide) pyrophosphoryl-undecaprenol N-acetylglucosamine transferase